MPYEWEILLELPDTAEAVYDMEVKFKTEMQEFQYKPKIAFNGLTDRCNFSSWEKYLTAAKLWKIWNTTTKSGEK